MVLFSVQMTPSVVAGINFNQYTNSLEWSNECIWNAIICIFVSELFAFDLTAFFACDRQKYRMRVCA